MERRRVEEGERLVTRRRVSMTYELACTRITVAVVVTKLPLDLCEF